MMLLMAAMLLADAATGTPAKVVEGQGPNITAADYPREAAAQRQEGTVAAIFTIGANGAVSACEIEQSSGHSALDSRTCEVFMRSRWVPARDDAGKAVESRMKQKISWKLDDLLGGDDPNIVRGDAILSYGRDGMISSCRLVRPTGDAAEDKRLCQVVIKHKVDTKHYDADGQRRVHEEVVPFAIAKAK